jgi:hypothetical protein
MLDTLAACRRHGIRFSIIVRQIKTVTAAIAAISEAAWTDIDYPDGGVAQVAESTLGPDRLTITSINPGAVHALDWSATCLGRAAWPDHPGGRVIDRPCATTLIATRRPSTSSTAVTLGKATVNSTGMTRSCSARPDPKAALLSQLGSHQSGLGWPASHSWPPAGPGALTRWPVARRNQGGYAARMSDSTNPISPPPKPPEREAEIRQLLTQVAQGDLSGTIPWEEVAAELGLPGRSGP